MSDLIIAIDPGNIESAYVVWDGQKVSDMGKVPNNHVLDFLTSIDDLYHHEATLVIEMVASYGLAVGHEVFETCVWIGRFQQHWLELTSEKSNLVFRREVKLHHTHSPKANDSNVRQALIDRFGAPGTKANPNPITYGMRKDIWQAFALAVYWYDNFCREAKEAA